MSRAEMRERMGALEHRAEQTWASHQVILLDEMNSVAGNAREDSCSVKQMRNFKDTKVKAVDIFKNTSKTFNAIGKKFNMKFKVGNFVAEKKL